MWPLNLLWHWVLQPTQYIGRHIHMSTTGSCTHCISNAAFVIRISCDFFSHCVLMWNAFTATICRMWYYMYSILCYTSFCALWLRVKMCSLSNTMSFMSLPLGGTYILNSTYSGFMFSSVYFNWTSVTNETLCVQYSQMYINNIKRKFCSLDRVCVDTVYQF